MSLINLSYLLQPILWPSFSWKPALITTAARVPNYPSSETIPGTVAAGVQIMASSGMTGKSSIR